MTEKPLPWIKTVTVPKPSLRDNTADADRLIRALKPVIGTESIRIDLELLKRLPRLLREAGFAPTCILFKDRNRWILTDVLPRTDAAAVAGLAADLGTTRITLRLIDLKSMATLGESSFLNPQVSVGPDILTRIHFSEKPEGLQTLNRLLIDAFNRHMESLCRSLGMGPENVYILSVAGNTTMTHLFLGIDPRWIIREPYAPVINRPDPVKASELGIRAHSAARVRVFPNVGSYLGGDLIAGVLFSGIHKRRDTSMLLDVGTNAEVILGNADWLMGCAGAAGPALEGGVTRMGTTAGPGVIDRIERNPSAGPDGGSDADPFLIHTIDDLPPRGICGSGLIDLAACLFETGMIDIRGKLVPEKCGSKYRKRDDLAYFRVVSAEASSTEGDLTISQADIESLIPSKAAMYTILETITLTVGVSFEEISTFFVAGAFGTFINPRSAIIIGMLPDLPLNRYQSIGNSSLEGATLAMTSGNVLEEIDRIRDTITYLELNVNQDFMNRFSAAKFIPHTDMDRFPSVKRSR